MSDIELNISIDEANVILEALGQMPFARVYALVSKLQDQAARQLKSEATGPAEVTQLDPQSVAEG